MERISTLNLNSMTIGGALKSQTQWAKAELQQSSGLISEDFAGYGSTSSQLLSLEGEIKQAKTYSTSATSVGQRTQSMYSAIGSMITTMTSIQNDINTAISATDKSGLLSQLQSLQSTLVSEMNTKYTGDYVFSGSSTSTAPVDLSNYTLATTSTTYTVPASGSASLTSYYAGDDTASSVRISAQQTVNYGVTGDNTAFQQALAAVQVAINVASALNAGTLTSAAAVTYLDQTLTTLTSANTNLSNLQATVAANASTLSTAATTQTTYVTFLENSLSNVKDVDAAQVASQAAAYKTQLTASYTAVADVAKTSLAQYL